MVDIDPKDAGTVVDVTVADLHRPANEAERQQVIVRLLRLRRRDRTTLPPGARVRQQVVRLSGESYLPRAAVAEFVTYAATYTRYDAQRIAADLEAKFRSAPLVRVSSVRALMHSVRLPQVKETVEYEEAV